MAIFPTTVPLPDFQGDQHPVTFNGHAEHRACWLAAWQNMVGIDPRQGPGSQWAYGAKDQDTFPGQRGTWEYVTNVLAGLRSRAGA